MPHDSQRFEALVAAALAKATAAERAAFLEGACAEDVELRLHVVMALREREEALTVPQADVDPSSYPTGNEAESPDPGPLHSPLPSP